MERQKGVAIDEGEGQLGIKLRKGIAAAGKRGGPCTPVPAWKLQDHPAPDTLDPDGAAAPAVSARKLGAGLWEVQDLLLPPSGMSRRAARPQRRTDVRPVDELPDLLPPASPRDRSRSTGGVRRHAAASLMKHNKLNERHGQALQPVSPATYSSSMVVSAFNQASSPSSSLDLKGRLGESGYSIKTSRELLKVLNRIWSLEEQNASNKSQVKALKVELDRARARIRELMQEQKAYHYEMDDLMNQVAEDKIIRKNKEQDRINAVVKPMREELEDERRLRRHSESLHRKLGKELSSVKTSYSKALKYLESERKANSLLENLCDEFAKGVRDYEQEVRELKQKAAKDFDRKTDRLVLHMSEAWLDERLQMKIAESQGDVAEKSTVVHRLSSEIETFLQARHSASSKSDTIYQKDSNLRRQSRESVRLNGTGSAPQAAEDDDSVASDLHCFELNMIADNNGSNGQPKPHCEDGREKIEPTRKFNFGRKKMVYSEKGRGQNLSILGMQFEEQIDSPMSCNGSKAPLVDNAHGMHSQNDAGTRGVEANHSKIVMLQDYENFHAQEDDRITELKWARMHQSDQFQSELCGDGIGHHDNHHGDEYHSRLSWRGHFVPIGEDNTSIDFHTQSSPVQQWNFRHISPDHEISECSTKLPKEVKVNTLKAKLLEARLEGQHARLKVSKGSSVG